MVVSLNLDDYHHLRSGGHGFYMQDRGLICVWGKEAVQFLDGMITNDVKTLEDGEQMLAAFPNAQGRLLAVVRVLRRGDRFLIETEAATREKLYQNLFRFTFAGDFFVEDLSDQFQYFELFGLAEPPTTTGGWTFRSGPTFGHFAALEAAGEFQDRLVSNNAIAIDDDLYETLRIDRGIPKYGVDMDEDTVVPELGLDRMISYTKGCYVGQEIIARIHFRGHVAKQLAGLVFDGEAETRPAGSVPLSALELSTTDGRNAGRVTSAAFSPKLQANVALAYVRYDYLAEGTELRAGAKPVRVVRLPFIELDEHSAN